MGGFEIYPKGRTKRMMIFIRDDLLDAEWAYSLVIAATLCLMLKRYIPPAKLKSREGV